METPLSRMDLLREVRKMRFEEAYEGWRERRLTQEEAEQLPGMSVRNFRGEVVRYKAKGLEGLSDQRIERVSSRQAPVDEVLTAVQTYQSWHDDSNVKHFHGRYRREGLGMRNYSWVNKMLQEAIAVPRAGARGKRRRKRDRRPLAGMLLHQDGNRQTWVAGPNRPRWDER